MAEIKDNKAVDITEAATAKKAQTQKKRAAVKKPASKSSAKSTASAKKKLVKSSKADKTKKNTAKDPKKQKKAENLEKPSKSGKRPLNIKFLGGLLFKKMAGSGASELGIYTEKVNKLNVFPVPDGDTGDNMRMTIESGVSAIEDIESDNLADVAKSLSRGMLLGARGNSGVILSQFFAGMAKGLENSEVADVATFGKALEEGVKQAYSSVMTPTEGTILTVARESVEYAVSRITPKSTIRTLFDDLVREMYDAVDRTPEILTVLKEAHVVDSGGAGLFYIMDGFNRVLNGEELKPPKGEEHIKATALGINSAFGPDSVMTYGYCTECLLQLQNSKCDVDNFDIEGFKNFLVSLGDSVVAFKTESIVKLHVHTLTPEKVLAGAREYGEFLSVKIENMSVQHTEAAAEEEKETATAKESVAVAEKLKKYGVVAVCSGEGVANIFRDFGADEIINGGQTNNPSTNDFLEAFEKIKAEEIFVFPNNGNIFMAAQQAAELYSAAKVHVLPSKNIGTGYVALSSADLTSENTEEILASMEEAMKRVTAGYVSPSIRDAELNGIVIHTGDTIGIIDKEIVVSEPDLISASCELADMLLSREEKFMLTVFTGADAPNDVTEELTAYLSDKHSDKEVYFIEGGQDIYPYIFVAE